MFVPLMLCRMCRKNEKELKEELSSLKSHLQRAVEDCERLSDQLEQKVRSTKSNKLICRCIHLLALTCSNNAYTHVYGVDSHADIKFDISELVLKLFLLSIPEKWAVQIRKWRIEEIESRNQ